MSTYIRKIRLTATATGDEPISLEQAKAQLRIGAGFTADDTYIQASISIARDAVENYCNRFFAESDHALLYDTFPGGLLPIKLPLPDVTIVTAITYTDIDNVVSPVVGYTLDAERQTITPGSAWPTDAISVRVELTAGPPVAFDGAIQSMMLGLTDIYENRSAQDTFQIYENKAAVSLMQPYRVDMGI